MSGMEAQWAPVPGYEGRYEVSSRGLVRSLGMWANSKGGSRQWRPGRVLKFGSNGQYRAVKLSGADGRQRMHRVHRMMLEAFVGPAPADAPCALHANDNPTDNRLENLRWGSRSENTHDAVENGGHVQARKEECLRGHLLVGPNLMIKLAERGYRQCRSCNLAQVAANHDAKLATPRTRTNRTRDGFQRRLGEPWEQEADRRYEHLMSLHPQAFGRS